MHTRTGRWLIYAATILSLGHHLDHAIRGNHIGWPLNDQVTPFTYSLAVYPLILLGLWLSRTGRAGAGYWLWLSGSGALFLAAVHFGPAALEPPHDIVGEYSSPVVGAVALGWLLALIAVLVVTFAYELRVWRRERRQG